ncbi:hypothetical protein D3C84_1091200 [compost metagenome]
MSAGICSLQMSCKSRAVNSRSCSEETSMVSLTLSDSLSDLARYKNSSSGSADS